MSTTPKASSSRMRRNLSASDSLNTVNSNLRCNSRQTSSSSMHDMSLNVSSVKKRYGGGRVSLAPSHLMPPTNLKKFDAESVDTELGLLYDSYLQTLMTDILLKKKASENENKILNQLASTSKTHDLGIEKLAKIQKREKDIRFLSNLQNSLDLLIEEVRSNVEDLNTLSIKEKLDKLKLYLEPFDFLRCQGIELPEIFEDREKFQKILDECRETVCELNELLIEKNDNLKKVKSELTNSIEIHDKIKSLGKTLFTTLDSLQRQVLKTASQSLAETIP